MMDEGGDEGRRFPNSQSSASLRVRLSPDAAYL